MNMISLSIFVFGICAQIASAEVNLFPVKGITCARQNTRIHVTFVGYGQGDVGKIDPLYSVTVSSPEKTISLIQQGVCFFAYPVDIRAFTCYDVKGAQIQNTISTSILGNNSPGYSVNLWSEPGGVLNAEASSELGLGPLDKDNVAHYQIPYSQSKIPDSDLIDMFEGYCLLDQ